ncbi:MAG: hypothetical protein E6Q34_07830 [Burkholderiaceae bacterium]|nr:MAG: hypothetical protein E6Q34_07830 [Burkholderiaceae bacterium]
MKLINIEEALRKLPQIENNYDRKTINFLGPEYRFVRYETLRHENGGLTGAWCKTPSEVCSTPHITGTQDTRIFGCAREFPACPNYPTHMHMEWLLKGDPNCPKSEQ